MKKVLTSIKVFLVVVVLLSCGGTEPVNHLKVIAYYSAGPDRVDALPVEKLDQVIYSFCHLKGNRLAVDDAEDSLTIRKLVALKARKPGLQVVLSLGGWGGCKSCSDVFSTDSARREFAQSVLELNQGLGTDGIDLDWEYPVIEGFPGHPFKLEDKANFTALIQALRKTLGAGYQVSFAAGGFQKYLEDAIEWDKVMPLVDRVNIMSYDLVGGYATVTGHHTPLYSTPQQKESADNAVQYLASIGVPRNKMVIGGAFYARVWEQVPHTNNGLYQPGVFKQSIDYKDFDRGFEGFKSYWDDVAQAPYRYDAKRGLYATHDDERSIALKTRYAIDQQLEGIMFWELPLDKPEGGMLDAIIAEKEKSTAKSSN
ncbi:MAG: glycoside hydrolase family 18 protein [Cyclobacteriaceae bacterium]|nr:glycoside hydrolase family 18 protein [Cyclobacteriaceae bacterium]